MLDSKEKIAGRSGTGLKSLVVLKYGSKEPIYRFWREELRERASSEGDEEVGIQNELKNKVEDGKRDR